jgi:hypothetical protein
MTSTLDQSKFRVNHKNNGLPINPWDAAKAEAKRRIAALCFSIRVFDENERKGKPWLGTTHN